MIDFIKDYDIIEWLITYLMKKETILYIIHKIIMNYRRKK
ncbi:hypothetical protein J2Z76_000712 [Sedimentibacter acidaminivorans]|uniref:Uncharacterized protein n=1 Tax=Sedimentibacter acidaminivorans TaxID=913099 RepID=A0ABS4GBS2_9FIRM|nr:hypothetical protein [Sedimentibacter acidaminivorans]